LSSIIGAKEKASERELRGFGLVLGGLFVAFFAALPFWRHREVFVWPWPAAVLLWSAALIAPRALAWPHRLWSGLGEGLGWVNTRVILGAIFFLMITPVSIITRSCRRDPLRRRFETSLDTYATASRSRDRESMEKPY
jgi:multisubunit Na+/H+ antiporter MnhG subunit